MDSFQRAKAKQLLVKSETVEEFSKRMRSPTDSPTSLNFAGTSTGDKQKKSKHSSREAGAFRNTAGVHESMVL